MGVIISVSNIYLLIIPPIISEEWFLSHEKLLYTAVMYLFYFLGNSIGDLILSNINVYFKD